jgi:multiple sugar transport system substrate-binding protein
MEEKYMKNRGKKIVIMIAALSLVLGMGLQPAAAQVKITMWSLFSGGEGHIMSDLIARFNAEHPDIVIEEQLIEWAQYYNKLLTGLLSGEAPDIGIMHLAVLPDYASRGVLSPIEGIIPQDFTDKFLDNILEKAYYDEHLFAVPIDTHPMVMYYNKKTLKEAGLVDANGEVLVPKTWNELMDYAKKVKEATGKWGFTAENTNTGAMIAERSWIALYSQLGAEFLDPATGKLAVDVEKAAKAYETIAALYQAELGPAPIDYAEGETLFVNGGTAYHLNGVWAMAVYPETEGLEFGVTSIPTLEGDKPYTWGDSHSFVFPQKGDDAKLKAALTFAQWFSEHTMEWAKAGHLPVNKAVMESEEFMHLPMRQDYVGVGETAMLAPSVKGWSQIREEMWEIGQRVVLGELTPQAAAEELKQKIEEISE